MNVRHRIFKPPVTVETLMSRSVIAADPRQSIAEAAVLMQARRVSALALVAGEEIVGIITERDLARAIADGRDLASAHVSDYMQQSPLTIEATENATAAAALMKTHRVRHLPVTRNGALVGFLSARDLLALGVADPPVPVGEPW